MKDINLTKQILSGQEIRDKLVKGATVLADSVSSTLGPFGRNVIIALNKYGESKITKDGVSVAKEIFLKDKYENLGAQLLKKVSLKTAQDAGDGTTSSTVLARFLLNVKDQQVSNVHFLKKGMEGCCAAVVEQLKKLSKPINTIDDIYNVAMVSSNQDSQISQLIADCYRKLGIGNIVIKLDSSSVFPQSWIEVTKGFQYDKGLPSPYLVNNLQKMEMQYNDCYVLLFDSEINSFDQLVPYLEPVIRNKCLPLVVVANEYKGDSLDQIVVNKTKNKLEIGAIEGPGYGGRRKLLLEDIEIQTGGTVISKERGTDNPEDVLNYVGKLKSITSGQFNTILEFGYGDKQAIAQRIECIRESLDKNMEFDRNLAEERISKLTSGMAILHVGGKTELEVKEAYDRAEDAVWAVKSAVQEGICPGGGVSYILASLAVDRDLSAECRDYVTGYNIVASSLVEVTRQLFKNAGIEQSFEQTVETIKNEYKSTGKIVVPELTQGSLQLTSFDNSTVIDPCKVLRCAIENAVSVCGLIVSTEVGIVFEEDLDVNSVVRP